MEATLKPQAFNLGTTARTLFWLTLFSIAMGYLETAVVVYVRALYYPDGFEFPLVPISHTIAETEFYREIATIVMLVGAGIMAGKNAMQRFVFFLYCFAIWDIFYYVFLYVLLGWPRSLLTWDVLFLIPAPWVGPVLCPCLVSCTMIAFAGITLYAQSRGHSGRLSITEWAILIAGCGIVITSFMWDYILYVRANGNGLSAFTLSTDKELFSEAPNYIPIQFNWMFYWCGQVVLWLGLGMYALRIRNVKSNQPL